MYLLVFETSAYSCLSEWALIRIHWLSCYRPLLYQPPCFSTLEQHYLVYFPEDDTVAEVKEMNILEPPVTKMKKGVSCSVEWSDGCIYAGKILGIGKEVK